LQDKKLRGGIPGGTKYKMPCYKNTEDRNKQRKRNYDKGNFIKNNKQRRWKKEDEEFILQHKFSDRKLAIKFSSSVEAIQAKRWRLNNLQVINNKFDFINSEVK